MKIGWIGTGVMGKSMLQRLLKAGHECFVYTRTREKAEPLLESGAIWSESPKAAAANADFVCSMVGMPNDVEEVALGVNGVIHTIKQGTIFIDFTTSSPELAKTIAARFAEAGAMALDAPVSGGDVGAKNGTLSIMVGGENKAFERSKQIFEVLGKTIVLQGSAGSGQHAKMVNQTLIATTMIGVCEALKYAEASGLDPRTVLRSVGGGAAASWSLSNLAPRILDGDFEPGFFVEHFIKDMGIALEEAKKMNLRLPGLELAYGMYQKLAERPEMLEKGTQALYLLD